MIIISKPLSRCRSRWLLSVLFFCFSACSMSGSVTTELENAYPVVKSPTEFQSPVEALRLFFHAIRERGLLEKLKQNRLSEEESIFLETAQVLLKEQLRREKALSADQVIGIEPGHSYSFDLESFCVNAGHDRPLDGDGFRAGPLDGKAREWLPTIINAYKAESIPQRRTQTLVWHLLAGARFDDLSFQEKTDLLKMDPKAAIHFGNRLVEEKAKDLFWQYAPSELQSFKDQVDDYSELFRDTKNSYEDISEVLAPMPSRIEPVSMGWVRAPQGYLIRLKSLNAYSSVRAEIYVPPSISSSFKPSKILALPAQGQRLAVSANALGVLESSFKEIFDVLVDWRAGQKLSNEEHDLIRAHPLDAYQVRQNQQKAVASTQRQFSGNEVHHNNEADAYRHFLWAALNARDLGEERARQFLEAHEQQGGPEEENRMDMHNNEQGVLAVRRLGQGATIEQIEQEALNLLRMNKLKVLH